MIKDAFKYGQHNCTAYIDGRKSDIRLILLPATPANVNDEYLKERYRWSSKRTTNKNMLNRWRAAVYPDLGRGRMQMLQGDVQGYIAHVYSERAAQRPQDMVALLDVLEGRVVESSSQLKTLTFAIQQGLNANFIIGIFRPITPQMTVDELAQFRFNLNDIKSLIEALRNE